MSFDEYLKKEKRLKSKLRFYCLKFFWKIKRALIKMREYLLETDY